MNFLKKENLWYYISIVLLIISALLLIFVPESFIALALQILAAIVTVYSIINVVRLSKSGNILVNIDMPIYIALIILGIFVIISPLSAVMLVCIGFGLYYIATGVWKIIKIYHLLQSNIYKKTDFIIPSLSVIIGIVLLFFSGTAIKIASMAAGIVILLKTILIIIDDLKGNKAKPESDYIESDFVDKSE